MPRCHLEFTPGARVVCWIGVDRRILVGAGYVVNSWTAGAKADWVYVRLDTGGSHFFRLCEVELSITQQIANVLKG